MITSEDRFWDACRCAPVIMSYVTDLLGLEATRWQFGKAFVRSGHVSTMFVCPGRRGDALELWVSASNDRTGGWTLQHSELPDPVRR